MRRNRYVAVADWVNESRTSRYGSRRGRRPARDMQCAFLEDERRLTTLPRSFPESVAVVRLDG